MINRTNKQRHLIKELFETDSDNEDETDSLEDFSEDDEEDSKERAPRRPNKEQNHLEGHQKLMQDYFDDGSTYDNSNFKRRFQMRNSLFLKIAADVESFCPYFVQKPVSFYLYFCFFVLLADMTFTAGLYWKMGLVLSSEDHQRDSPTSLRVCDGCDRRVLPYRRSHGS
jgi:hypothetical protein